MIDNRDDGIEEGEESFADLLESFDSQAGDDVRVGDKIRGAIIAIGEDAVFVDTGTKSDGIVEKDELLDEDGQLSYKVGDLVELYVVSNNGQEIKLSRALSGIGGVALLRDAYESGVPVEGKVEAPCKGGFQVEVLKRRAFCPVSQMDLRYVENFDDYVGGTYQFLITQFEEDGRNIVVSRRRLMEQEQQKVHAAFLEDLKEGDIREGRVTKLMPYGAFVELIPGIEGMVHLSELSWSRVEKADEVISPYDVITVKVIGISQGAKGGLPKIALSVKQVTSDPWETVEEQFHPGQEVKGTAKRCAKFGVFVEIAPGIEGLVHISEMSYRKRIMNPEDVVKPGQVVGVMIKEVDPKARRISLSMKDVEGDPWLEVGERYRVGQIVRGRIEKKEGFGIFVSLEPGVTGLLPKSNLDRSPDAQSIAKLREGDTIPVIVHAINAEDRKITLGPGDGGEETDWQAFTGKGKAMGSLGAMLQKALDAKKP